jgi:hypothetical protein
MHGRKPRSYRQCQQVSPRRRRSLTQAYLTSFVSTHGNSQVRTSVVLSWLRIPLGSIIGKHSKNVMAWHTLDSPYLMGYGIKLQLQYTEFHIAIYSVFGLALAMRPHPLLINPTEVHSLLNRRRGVMFCEILVF